ncbi:DUF418 domain-containing protein [Nocardia uniformis]|uniref:DUF418 domain-containing protein n=1 Tax=Nocardia uniformis TaxID=53432 RepID=A0A849BVD2_9NOCA|nr:DUF418 domain-containing protein [Nocardia uniformis]NNH68886.1 DUF418 domain-containing protein [Nocardia uniformis]
MSDPVVAPSSAGRIGEIDVLRGFALFGILVTNVVVMTTLLSFTGPNSDPQPLYDGTWDRLVYGLVNGFFLGKFYLLFAFLFGYSFTLQIAAAERVGAAPVRRLLRRSGALFLIGLAHVALLWLGDILTLYAGLCLILVLLRKIRPRTALITGAVLYLLFAAVAFIPGSGDIEGLGNIFDLERFREGYTGSFSETFFTQIHVGPVFMLFIWLAQGVPSLAMFLIGMAAGKRRIFEDAALLRRWTPRALWLGCGVGLPISLGTVVMEMKNGSVPSFWYGLQELVNPLVTLTYVAAIVWLARTRWAAPLGRLAPAGRMAASNYIFQSVVLMLVYTGYGLALGDRVPPATVVAIALVTYAAQLWLSVWWLRGHPYGPVEWLLRAATYRQWPTWRRTPAPDSVNAS